MELNISQVRQLSQEQRIYCFDCQSFVKDKMMHSNHKHLSPVSDEFLNYPTRLLSPLEESKKEAQYFFTQESVTTIVNMIEKADVKKLLCIGAPRIHEKVVNCKSNIQSVLLDIDERYRSFYEPPTYLPFNMFNHHLFDGKEAVSVLRKFLECQENEVVGIVTDPPFGGRVELISNTLTWISHQWMDVNGTQLDSHCLPFFWIFPYFMEQHISSSLPSTHMLDYKINYANHDSFSQGKKGRKHGSPVRIFTNVSPSLIPLPAEEGYRFCSLCRRWVSQENKHCSLCNSCTSKDGRTYVHCNTCNRCVKPSWKHCDKCQRCCLTDHPCGLIGPPLCKSCKQEGHKWRDCHLREGKQISKRKPLDDLIGSSKKECTSAKKKRKLSITHCGSEWYVSEIK
ncbi:rRNA N6-adenosine-methyltransferase ZCCHC4-like isoform X2 [Artemia franciscana]